MRPLFDGLDRPAVRPRRWCSENQERVPGTRSWFFCAGRRGAASIVPARPVHFVGAVGLVGGAIGPTVAAEVKDAPALVVFLATPDRLVVAHASARVVRLRRVRGAGPFERSAPHGAPPGRGVVLFRLGAIREGRWPRRRRRRPATAPNAAACQAPGPGCGRNRRFRPRRSTRAGCGATRHSGRFRLPSAGGPPVSASFPFSPYP